MCRPTRLKNTCTTYTRLSPIFSTACRAISSRTARRRCWCCRMTPILIRLQTSIQVASLAPNAEITVFPWRDPPELKARTINRVRKFLRENRPAAS